MDLRSVKIKRPAVTCRSCVHVQGYGEQHLQPVVAKACAGDTSVCRPLYGHSGTVFGLGMCFSHLLTKLSALLPTSAEQLPPSRILCSA